MRPRFVISTLASTLLAAACGDDKNTTDGSSGTGVATTGLTDSTVGPTMGMSSDPTTTGGAEGTAEGTAGMTTLDSTTTSTEPNPTEGDQTTATEPNETTGPVDPDIMSGCMAVCTEAVDCMVMRDVAACTAECGGGLGDAEGQCKKATQAFLDCVVEMTCEQMAALFNDEDPGPCTAQQAASDEECDGGGLCGISIGGDPEGTACSMQLECEGEPTKEMQCDTEVCTCLEGGRMVGMCPAEGVCMDEDLIDKAADCCGF